MSLVRIPLLLRRLTGGTAELDLPGATAGECLAELERRCPRVSAELRDEEGALRPSVNLYVNGQDVRHLAGLDTPLSDGDELTIILAIAGGTRRTEGPVLSTWEAVVARDLLAALARGPLVCDGAMGTMLLASGVEARCPEEINLLSPETVRNVHAAYLAAGADVIETNSFGGSRAKLEKSGLAGSVSEINRVAARIARDAAGESALVAGSIGPLGELLEPLGALSRGQAVAVFREQAEALADGGADFFIVETMFDLTEALAAVEGAKAMGLSVICTMTFDTNLHTMMGVSPTRAVAELRAAGAVAVGANCGVGPGETLKAIEEMHQADPDAWLAAQPNAGVPKMVEGAFIYTVSAEEMATFVPGFVAAGVRLVGSCCGSSPEYTKAIVRAVEASRP